MPTTTHSKYGLHENATLQDYIIAVIDEDTFGQTLDSICANATQIREETPGLTEDEAERFEDEVTDQLIDETIRQLKQWKAGRASRRRIEGRRA